ncbi:MAG: hypothetical protein AB7H96_14510 [Vicinamibacterales bacterium]
MPRFTWFCSTIAAFGLVAFGASACSPAAPPDPSASQAGPGQVTPQYDRTGKLEKIEYDRNRDGKTDTWGYMDGTRVVKVEEDRNGDGAVDRWEYHRADGPAPIAPPAPDGAVDPSIERIEEATRFDGKVSRWEFFAGGLLTRTEEDTDGNGKVDKWETYENGGLSLMALDTTGRGTPDRRLVYRPDGSLDRIESDPEGSGQFRTTP